jgi:hypothetical protein
MTDPEAYTILHTFITRERAMREQVFRNKPDLRKQKLAQCDKALAALEILKPEDQPTQSNLFNEAPK